MGKARFLVQDDGILGGVQLDKMAFNYVHSAMEVEVQIDDGTPVKCADIALCGRGKSQSILKAERVVLNCMQRMSAIATKTRYFTDLVGGTKAKVLDTRKTTPGIRAIEKWAVKIGGGENHRFALYDMIM